MEPEERRSAGLDLRLPRVGRGEGVSPGIPSILERATAVRTSRSPGPSLWTACRCSLKEEQQSGPTAAAPGPRSSGSVGIAQFLLLSGQVAPGRRPYDDLTGRGHAGGERDVQPEHVSVADLRQPEFAAAFFECLLPKLGWIGAREVRQPVIVPERLDDTDCRPAPLPLRRS